MARYFLDSEREPRECPGRPFFGGPRTVYQHRAKIVCDTKGCGFEHVADPPEGVSYERHLRRDGKRCRKPSLRRSECFCHGTGRLGEEGAEPDVEIINGWDSDHQHLVKQKPEETEYRWRIIPKTGDGYHRSELCDCGQRVICWGHWMPRGHPPDAALAAARKAHREES